MDNLKAAIEKLKEAEAQGHDEKCLKMQAASLITFTHLYRLQDE